MSERDFLSQGDLHDLTGYVKPAQQADWLTEHGIPHRRDGGRIIVSRIHARDWLAGRPVTATVRPSFSRAQAH